MRILILVAGWILLSTVALAQVPTQGLVAYYPFSGNANDATGTGNNGTSYGGVFLDADRFGNPNAAYSFNGSGYITVNNSNSLQIGDMFSMAFWFKVVGIGRDPWMALVTKAAADVSYYSGPRAMLAIPNYPDPPIYYDYEIAPPPYSSNISPIPIELNYWYHWTLTVTSDSVRSYLNGQFTSAFPRDYSWSFSNSNPLTIGSQNGSFYNRFFKGSLDEVRIYNRALSQGEIDILYHEGGNPPGLTPPWKFTNTGISHTIIIPKTVTSDILGSPLSDGDYIGVFYDSLGTLACAGYERWNGTSNIAVSAFGDDPTTIVKDGYANGELFKWKVFKAAVKDVYDADASYSPTDPVITHTNLYSTNGISRLVSLHVGFASHCLNLRSGWSLISSYVVPQSASLDSIFQPLLGDVIILKNGAQKIYIPSVPVNSIGPWVKTEGYQLKMARAGSLCFNGLRIPLGSTPVSLPVGWSILPYLRDSEMSVATVLSSIASDIVIMKDQDGKTFIPLISVDGIGTMKAGQGYQIKMLNTRSLVYPASTAHDVSSLAPVTTRQKSSILLPPPWYFSNTGTSHTIVIPIAANPKIDGTALAAGDYVGVFYDSSGTLACAGYEQWTGTGNVALAAFGDDATTPDKDGLAAGEVFKWKIWRHNDGRTFVGLASYLPGGSLSGIITDSSRYAVNGISALSALNAGVTAVNLQESPTDYELSQNYPNPFNPSTIIRYALPTRTYVIITVHNSLGQQVAILVNGQQEAGSHEVWFDTTGFSSGTYFYTMQTGNFVETKKLILVH